MSEYKEGDKFHLYTTESVVELLANADIYGPSSVWPARITRPGQEDQYVTYEKKELDDRHTFVPIVPFVPGLYYNETENASGLVGDTVRWFRVPPINARWRRIA